MSVRPIFLCLHSAVWASDWACKATHLVLNWCVLQEVLWQDVRTIKRVLLSVCEWICFSHWEIRWCSWLFAKLITIHHILGLLDYVNRTWFQHCALHCDDGISTCQNTWADVAADIGFGTPLSSTIIELTQATERWFLTQWLFRIKNGLLLLHIFFWCEKLLTVVCILFLRPNTIWLIPAKDFRVIVLDGDSALQMALLFPIGIADLGPLHYFSKHSKSWFLFIWFWSDDFTIDFDFQWFFFVFLIFCLLDLNRLCFFNLWSFFRRNVSACCKRRLVS